MVPRNIIWIVSIVPILRTMIGATNRKMHQDLMRSILVSIFEDAWVLWVHVHDAAGVFVNG